MIYLTGVSPWSYNFRSIYSYQELTKVSWKIICLWLSFLIGNFSHITTEFAYLPWFAAFVLAECILAYWHSPVNLGFNLCTSNSVERRAGLTWEIVTDLIIDASRILSDDWTCGFGRNHNLTTFTLANNSHLETPNIEHFTYKSYELN